MTPLDLRSRPPRSPRETVLGFYMLPRTIDKLRAELPGGNMGEYVNHDAGLSAFVVKRVGLRMNELRDAVANAADESDVVRWLETRIDPQAAPALNEKLETFVIERMPVEDQARIRARHPSLNAHANMSKLLDILAADDRATFGDPLNAAHVAIAQRIADALSEAWNAGDGAAFARCFTESADFVNIYAAPFTGRDAVAKQHQMIFDSVYRGSTMTMTASRARLLAEDLALAHVASELRVPQGPMAGVLRTLATIVLVRRGGAWQIDAFHNTQVRTPGT